MPLGIVVLHVCEGLFPHFDKIIIYRYELMYMAFDKAVRRAFNIFHGHITNGLVIDAFGFSF